MKIVKFFVINLVLILVFTALSSAQTEKLQVSVAIKIATINTDAFNDKTNEIQEIVDAYDKLEARLKSQKDELLALTEEIKKLKDGLKYLSGPPNPKDPPIEVMNNRVKEYKLAVINLEIKQDDVKSIYDKRKSEIFADIYKKVGNAIKQFAKENGYLMLIDIAKLKDGTIILNPEINDITKEFIKYYNENFAKTKSR